MSVCLVFRHANSLQKHLRKVLLVDNLNLNSRPEAAWVLKPFLVQGEQEAAEKGEANEAEVDSSDEEVLRMSRPIGCVSVCVL